MEKKEIDQLIVELENANYFFGCDEKQELREKSKIRTWLENNKLPSEIKKDFEKVLGRKI